MAEVCGVCFVVVVCCFFFGGRGWGSGKGNRLLPTCGNVTINLNQINDNLICNILLISILANTSEHTQKVYN